MEKMEPVSVKVFFIKLVFSSWECIYIYLINILWVTAIISECGKTG